ASWRRRAWRRTAQTLLLLLFAIYIVMALPPVASRIAAALPAVPSPDDLDRWRLDLLITLAGDNADGRVNQTARAYSAAVPQVVWVLGPDWFVTRLVAAGLPAASMRQNAQPSTTRSQMQAVAELVAHDRSARIGVVASKLQMPRVASL